MKNFVKDNKFVLIAAFLDRLSFFFCCCCFVRACVRAYVRVFV